MVEVTHISKHGVWLLLPTEELFVSFTAFPWFRDATIAQLQKVKLLHRSHLFWPDLDGTWPWTGSTTRNAVH